MAGVIAIADTLSAQYRGRVWIRTSFPPYSSRTACDCCVLGHAEVVKLLVKAHALVDKANQKGTTALMRATQEGNEEVVRILVSAGADVSKRNNERMNALMLGSQVGATTRLRGEIASLSSHVHMQACGSKAQHSAGSRQS